MIIDFKRHAQTHAKASVRSQTVENVQSHKYFGMIIDTKLNFEVSSKQAWTGHLVYRPMPGGQMHSFRLGCHYLIKKVYYKSFF